MNNAVFKYRHALQITFSIIGIFFSFVYFFVKANEYSIFNITIVNGIYIFLNLLIIILTLFVENKFNKKVQQVLLMLSFVLFGYLLFDLIVLGLISCFHQALLLTTKPSKEISLGIRIAHILLNDYKSILYGVFNTLWLSLLGTIVGLFIAIIFALIKSIPINSKDTEAVGFLKKVAQGFVDIYVTVFRGTPMMVQAMIIFYFLPGAIALIFNIDQKVVNDFFSIGLCGFITVSLNTAAYLTEVLRGGISSINKGQMEAARSLGFSHNKAMFNIILPQTLKNTLPSICNEFIINIKDTSVLSVIQVMDLFFIIDTINGKLYNHDAIFIAMGIYLILTLSISKLLKLLEKKMNLKEVPLPSAN